MAFCGLAESVTIDCIYVDFDSTFGYACDVLNSVLVSSQYDREVASYRGFHVGGRDNFDVKYLKATFKQIRFFPRGLKKLFSGIESIQISSAQLQEITNEDLRHFSDNLKYLNLCKNQITYHVSGEGSLYLQ